MAFFIERKKSVIRVLRTFFFASAIFYFSYHIISGEKGAIAMLQLANKVEEARMESDDIKMNLMELEHKVTMLYPNSLDLDLLDEQARKILGQASGDEVIFIK